MFGEIGLPEGGKVTAIPPALRPLIKYSGIQLTEPELVFSNKAGTGLVRSPHPIRGIVENRPFDYPLTARGFFTGLRLGVICPEREARALHGYLQNVNHTLTPMPNERDYLVDYPGFQTAYGMPFEFPQPGEGGWFFCPEPTSSDPHTSALELAGQINRGVEMLQSSYAPHVVIFFIRRAGATTAATARRPNALTCTISSRHFASNAALQANSSTRIPSPTNISAECGGGSR